MFIFFSDSTNASESSETFDFTTGETQPVILKAVKPLPFPEVKLIPAEDVKPVYVMRDHEVILFSRVFRVHADVYCEYRHRGTRYLVLSGTKGCSIAVQVPLH